MSLDASGTIANTLVFSKWKAKNYVRLRVDPYNPKAAYQTGVRTSMTWAVHYWSRGSYITAAQKTWWGTYAEPEGISGFNRYVRFFMALNFNSGTRAFIYGGIPSPQ